MKRSDDITGRDGQLMIKALAYAIEAIERQPASWKEESDCRDMIDLLNAKVSPSQAEHARLLARHHLMRRPLGFENGKLVLADREGEVVKGVFTNE